MAAASHHSRLPHIVIVTRMAWKFAEIDKKALLDHNVQLQKRIVAMEEGCATLARL